MHPRNWHQAISKTRKMVTIIVRMPPIVIGNVETYNSTLMIYKKQIDAHAKHKLRLEDKCMKACSLFEGK